MFSGMILFHGKKFSDKIINFLRLFEWSFGDIPRYCEKHVRNSCITCTKIAGGQVGYLARKRAERTYMYYAKSQGRINICVYFFYHIFIYKVNQFSNQSWCLKIYFSLFFVSLNSGASFNCFNYDATKKKTSLIDNCFIIKYIQI